MSTVAMSGSDTININGRILNDLAESDCVSLSFPNDIAVAKTGKNGNSIYASNAAGEQCDVSLKIIRGSGDDLFLNNLLVQQKANFAGFVLMTGEFIKQVGDGAGNIASDTYILSGGIFNKNLEAKENTDGDPDQSTVMYHMKFTLSPRAIS
jgi:hypothetical protein